jgi:phosphomannomutase
VRGKADIGVATDGDGDRIGFVDEKGRKIAGDVALALMVQELLGQHQTKQKETQQGKAGKSMSAKKANESVLYEVRTSWAVKDTIEGYKAKPILFRAGSSQMKEKMKNDNILVGGEKSGP